jgi:predicted DNA repair protein MutK
MASGFFALFDDVATLLDDVATVSKVATKKTAGLLGDDLAVNAEKSSGFDSSREIPVIWKITKGSFVNKLIILPLTLLLSAFFPQAIIPILLIGGLYLAYEGAEKVYEFIIPHAHSSEEENHLENMDEIQIKKYENKKIKSAILVDFILSVEIVIIALSTVVEETLLVRIIVVSLIAILATIGVYGIVALIVRMDDFGFKLIQRSNNKKSISSRIGLMLVNALPVVIRSLAVIGTIAMLLVAGGIYVHNIQYIHDLFHGIPSLLADFITGLVVGLIVLIIVKSIKAVIKKVQN